MRVMAVLSFMLGTAVVGLAQTPATLPPKQEAAPATTQSTPASTLPKNIEKALEADVAAINLTNARLEGAFDLLRAGMHANIAVNWPALALTGITRDTPVTLRLSNVAYEQALRALLESLPATKSRPNYLVGDNAVEITTTAELGKLAVVKLFDISHVVDLSLTGSATPEQKAAHAEFLKKVAHAELRRAGEDVDGPGREIQAKDGMLVATQSRRGQLYIQQTIWRFAVPVRMADRPPGTQVSVQARKAQERMTELCGKGEPGAALLGIAKDPAKAAAENMNVVLLPGTAAELTKPAPELDYQVNEAGIVVIGPQADIHGRVMLVVYDLRDLLKRMELKSKQKPPPAIGELAGTVVTQLKAKVPPGRGQGAAWGEIDKSPTSMTLYESDLVVTASPAVQRAISAGLQELNR